METKNNLMSLFKTTIINRLYENLNNNNNNNYNNNLKYILKIIQIIILYKIILISTFNR